ncbi:MAG: polysaccharide biosynthesis/export family protein [Planctomycetaceae bacterium]
MFLRIVARQSTTKESHTLFRAGFALVLGLFVSLSGCRTVDYQAANLPSHLQPAPVYNAQSLDLARLSQGTSQADRVMPGDVLSVAVTTGIEERPMPPWPLRVDENGTVDVPLVGPVTVANMKWTDVDKAVRQVSMEREVYRNPKVSVTLQERETITVTVMGAVSKPGQYKLPAVSTDLVSALSAASGLTEEADTIVEIYRPAGGSGDNLSGYPLGSGNTQVTRVDLVQATQGTVPNLMLVDGTTVMVPKRAPQRVSVMGVVNKPSQYDIPIDRPMRLLDAIAIAGDRRMQFADRVSVLRLDPSSGKPVLIGASIRRARKNGQDNSDNIVLAPGDVVTVDETLLTTTIDALNNVVRFGFNSAVPGF